MQFAFQHTLGGKWTFLDGDSLTCHHKGSDGDNTISARFCSVLLLVHLSGIELEFLTLKDVAIATTRLTGARADASQKTTTIELIGETFLKLNSVLLESSQFSLDVSRSLGFSTSLIGLLNLLLVELNIVLAEIPQSEGVSIDLDDAVLHEGLGSDKLVVSGVVYDIENLALTGDGLRSPGVVASIKSQSSELVVGTSATDWANTLGAHELGHGGLTAQFELSLLLMNRHTAGGGSPLVS